MNGLEGAADGVDGEKNGIITAGELKSYLEREVPNRARALHRPAQMPMVSAGFKGDYVLALVPNGPVATQGVPAGAKVPNEGQIQRVQNVDPELALMLKTGVIQALTATSLAQSRTAPVDMPFHLAFEEARSLKVGDLHPPVTPDSLISPA